MLFLGEKRIKIEKEEMETEMLLLDSSQNNQEEVSFLPESESGQEWIQMTEKSKCLPTYLYLKAQL